MSASNFSLEALDSARHQHELARNPLGKPYANPTAPNPQTLSHIHTQSSTRTLREALGPAGASSAPLEFPAEPDTSPTTAMLDEPHIICKVT
jgi:hypothetical protein